MTSAKKASPNSSAWCNEGWHCARAWGKWDVLVLRYNYSDIENQGALTGARLEQVVPGFNGIE